MMPETDQYKQIPIKFLFIDRRTGAWGEYPDDEEGVVCIRAADFITNELRHSQNDLTRRKYTAYEIETKKLQSGDLIIEKSGGGENQPVGRVIAFELDEIALCSNFLERLRPDKLILHSRFGAYLLYSLWVSRRVIPFIKQTTGIQNLDIEEYFSQAVYLPPLPEQRAVAAYLDRETARLDALLAALERLLGLLAEKRQALIAHAVTRGLNPDAPLRDSGVAWLGEIPAHWKVSRLAFLFCERDERGQPDLPLLNVSIHTGVTIRELSDDHIEQMAKDFSVYKIAYQDDIAFNKMRMWQGAVGKVPINGLVSPDYIVAEPISNKIESAYYGELFHIGAFSAEAARNSHGIVWDRLRLYWEEFRNIRVPVPPIDEQQEIGAYVVRKTERLNKLSEAIKYLIELFQERRAALIAAVVSGELQIPR